MESMPASSKTDPPLARVDPISDGGSVSVITYLRRGEKKLLRNSSQEREVRIREPTLQTPRSEKEETGGAPGTRTDTHLQPVEDPTLEQGDAQRRL